MIADIKVVAARSSQTLIEDLIGVVALFAVLVAGLSLPALF